MTSTILTAGHLISAYALGVVIGAPVITVRAARVPREQLLTALMAVFTLGNLARFLAGLPQAPTSVSSRSSRPRWCPPTAAPRPSR